MFNKAIFCWIGAFLLILAGCSSTTITGSWKNPDFTGTIHKVYIVGIAKQDTTRRIFEDEFSRKLESLGATGISSYRDLPDPQQATKELVAERVEKNGADSVLMTRMIGKRTEEVVTPGRITSYSSGPYYGYPYPNYRQWGNYYDQRYETIYEPATVTQYQVVTIEANLYEVRTGELIWSAQLDTVIEPATQKLVAEFVEKVTEDLRQQGIL